MRLLILIILRMLSVFSCLLAAVAAGNLALGAYAVFTAQKKFPEVSPLKLGELHGEFIGAPVALTALFAMLAFVLWRLSSRFRTKLRPNSTFDTDAQACRSI
jgi:hypothetical protein